MIQLRDLQPDPPEVSRGRPIAAGCSCDDGSTAKALQVQDLAPLSYANGHRKIKVDRKTAADA